MKPESKKNRANPSNKSDHNKGSKKTASCYDLTNLSEALDVVEGKPTRAVVDAASQSMVKESDTNSSSFNLTKLSEELSAVEEEEKKRVPGLGCQVERMKEDIEMKQLRTCVLAWELLNSLNLSRESGSGWGTQTPPRPRRIIPILSRLQHIVALGDQRRRRRRAHQIIKDALI